MSRFNNCINFVLKHEGGVLKDSTTGEYSNFGITQTLLKAIDYRVTDPVNLTEADAWNIYLTQFWQKYRFDTYMSDRVAAKIMDMYVNMGPRNAALTIQRALKLKPEFVDGIIGPFTKGMIEDLGEKSFFDKLIPELKSYYAEIAKGPKEKYLAGWTKRAEDLPT